MAVDLRASSCHVVVGTSHRLREALIDEILAAWTGPVKRAIEPDDFGSILMGIDTPSLFEEPALHLIRCDDKWATKHADSLLPLVGREIVGGVVVLILPALAKNTRVGKAANSAKVYHLVSAPGPKELVDWTVGRLHALPNEVERPRQVAEALIDHYGADADALLGAIEVVALYAGDESVTPDSARSLTAGGSDKPIWEFTGAVFKGDMATAYDLLLTSGDLEVEPALSALAGELRKRLACIDHADDADVWAALGGRRGGSLYYARRAAGELGKKRMQRMLGYIAEAQRACRTGADRTTAFDLLLFRLRHVIRSRAA